MQTVRKTWLVALIFVVIVSFLCHDHADGQSGPVYLGDACFTLTDGGSQTPLTRTLRLSVLSFGVGHFSVDGGFIDPATQRHGIPIGNFRIPAHGTAVSKKNGNLVIALTSSFGTSDSVFTIEFDLVSGIYTAGRFIEASRDLQNCGLCIPGLIPLEVVSGTAAIRACPP